MTDELSDLKRKITSLQRKVRHQGTLEELVAQAAQEAVSRHLGPGRPPSRPKASKRRRGSPAAAQIVLTDWQLGKQTETFNVGACRARVHEAMLKALRVVEDRRTSFRVDHCDLMFLGDMVEGETIFEGQVWEIEVPVIDQMLAVADLMKDCIEMALETFKTVRVVCAAGNHGRPGQKKSAAHPDSNWDLVAYKMAQSMVGKHKGLSWLIHRQTYGVHEFMGWRVCVTHGDVQRGNPCVNWPKKLAKLQEIVPGGFDVLCHGHTHFPYSIEENLCWVIGTGSPESSNKFAADVLAATAHPSQRIFFMTEKYPVVGNEVLYLEPRSPRCAR